MADKFGELKLIDVRSIWPTEPADITPWLSQNIQALGSELGLDLELQTREAENLSAEVQLSPRLARQ